MMAANYRHIGGLENRLGRHYSRFSASWPAAPLPLNHLPGENRGTAGPSCAVWARGGAPPGGSVGLLGRFFPPRGAAAESTEWGGREIFGRTGGHKRAL